LNVSKNTSVNAVNYNETIQFLYNSTPVFEHVGASAYKEGLYNTHVLDEHFGHPHTQYKTIHIAGTNGKGSVSHTLAAILQSQGYKVGLYTSPHIVDFRERIRVNGKCVSERYVIDFVEECQSLINELHPSFFELTTAMVFKYFADEKVDIAIIEVGLGGRLDCTNIISPILSVITNISFDHTQFLGNTLAQIASEKAGIIKPDTPVVIGEATDETRHVFEAKANELNARIVFAEDNMQITDSESTPYYIRYSTEDFGEIQGELTGEYQIKNTNTILNAVKLLGDLVEKQSVKEGFANVQAMTKILGRWQTLQKSPLVICDTGHNAGGWQYLSKQISQMPQSNKRIVLGMVGDKDAKTVISMLPQEGYKYYITQPSCKRAMPKEQLNAIAQAHGLRTETFMKVIDAYDAALSSAKEDDFIFVGGSSYVVADLLENLKKRGANIGD
jgi:dihydrofolate synthase/folylpolyglutamate synthase